MVISAIIITHSDLCVHTNGDRENSRLETAEIEPITTPTAFQQRLDARNRRALARTHCTATEAQYARFSNARQRTQKERHSTVEDYKLSHF